MKRLQISRRVSVGRTSWNNGWYVCIEIVIILSTCPGMGLTYRVGQRKRGHRLTTITLSNLNRFKKNFTGRFVSKFAVKTDIKIPPHFAYVGTLPCETLLSATQAINDKLKKTVSTYLRCGGVVNNQIAESVCDFF